MAIVQNPNTIGQATQRSKFSAIVALIRQVLPLINHVYAGCDASSVVQ